MDGVGWVWISLSQLGRYSQLGLLGTGLVAGLVGFGFSQLKTCQLVATVYLQCVELQYKFRHSRRTTWPGSRAAWLCPRFCFLWNYCMYLCMHLLAYNKFIYYYSYYVNLRWKKWDSCFHDWDTYKILSDGLVVSEIKKAGNVIQRHPAIPAFLRHVENIIFTLFMLIPRGSN